MIRSFIKSNLDVLGGGIVFTVLGLLGFTYDVRILMGLSLLGIFLVSLQRLIRALKTNADLNRDFNQIVGCFRKCIVREAPGMRIDAATITYKIDPIGRQDRQERRYVIHAGPHGATAKHVYIGSHRDGTEYGKGFRASLVRSLQLEAEDVTPLNDLGEQKRMDVCAVPYTVDNKNLYVALGFDPAMQPDEVREVRVRTLRKGVWDELRATGVDAVCSYRVSKIPIEHLRIQVMLLGDSIMLKPGDLRIEPDAPQPKGSNAESRHSDAAAQTVAIWDIPNPVPGTTYRYAVKCEKLKPQKIPIKVRARKWYHKLRHKNS